MRANSALTVKRAGQCCESERCYAKINSGLVCSLSLSLLMHNDNCFIWQFLRKCRGICKVCKRTCMFVCECARVCVHSSLVSRMARQDSNL